MWLNRIQQHSRSNLKYFLPKGLESCTKSNIGTDPLFQHTKHYTNKFFFTMAQQHQWAKAFSLSRIHDHTQTHYTRLDSSGRVISPTQKHLPDNTQHSQQTDIHATGGIRTHNPSKRAAAEPRLRPRGHWDWHSNKLHISLSNGKTIKKKH